MWKGPSTVVKGDDSAPVSLPVVTRSVVDSVLDLEPPVVPSSSNRVPSVVVGESLWVDEDALGQELVRLSIASLSPEPLDDCVGTTATVAEDGVTAAGGPVDVVNQTEGE